MPYPLRRRSILILMVAVATGLASRGHGQGSGPLVPDRFELSETVHQAMEAGWVTDAERQAMRIQHGVWSSEDLTTPHAHAEVALQTWELDHPAFDDPSVPVTMRAQARLLRGDAEGALALLEGESSMRAVRLRGDALEMAGRYDDAVAALDVIPPLSEIGDWDDADEVVDALVGRITQARLEGRPSREYQSIMEELGRAHQFLDRTNWRATLAEGRVLAEKYNRRLAVDAYHATLKLHPRHAEAWFELGRIAVGALDFDGVERAATALQRLNAHHPLAALLRAESRMIQDDPDHALEYIAQARAFVPNNRLALQVHTAAVALTFDDDALATALATYDRLSPGSARAYFSAGSALSRARQYDEAAALLEEAQRRAPGWTAPTIAQGLMEMQSGRSDLARRILSDVVDIDPFNKRAGNSLHLLEEMADYTVVRTEHFVVRFKPGIDEVFADLMPDALEKLHQEVVDQYQLVPSRPTTIEVMPDHERFGVRITGMPDIHTIAACTGPVIAMEVPREGPQSKHYGTFDWVRVMRHEYTHTVTLEQTRNRIPHWLTEAAAVGMEFAPRTYGDCVMLSRSGASGTLFTLDEIKWGFVRPRKPGDRGKAYTQSAWMLEYMTERFGQDAVIDLLGKYRDGERESTAIESALGISRTAFYDSFLEWAEGEIAAWGLAPSPSMDELTDELRWADDELAIVMAASQKARLDAIARTMMEDATAPRRPGDAPLRANDWPELVRPPVAVSDEQLSAWRIEHADHPDLLELEIRRRLELAGEVIADLVPLFERLIELRPVDPFPHRRLAQYWLDSDTPARAIPHLEELDVREQRSAVFAWRLSELYRDAGELDRAHTKITRAVNMNPYHAGYRELAATVAIQVKDLAGALTHIRALTILEPDRSIHERRLEAIQKMLAG